jgi:sensor histidine kinase YesM
MKSPRKFPAWLQVLAWMLFLITPMLIAPPPNKAMMDQFRNEHFPSPGPYLILVFQLSLIGFFYVNAFYLIPKYLGKGNLNGYLYRIGIALISLLVLLMAAQFQLSSLFGDTNNIVILIYYLISLVLFLSIFLVSSGRKIIETWYEIEKEASEMRLQQVAMELSLLKSQINPHFLFNTLNSIYVLSEQKSEQTGEAIIRLSNMMRYVLHETHRDFVPVQQEIAYIQEYMAMQDLRLPSHIEVDFSIDAASWDISIAPMLLIAFVENAYKYGANTHEPTKIEIRIATRPGALSLYTNNQIFDNQNLIGPYSGHGLENVKRRLNLSYPNRHKLEVKKGLQFFSVHLHIDA